MNLQQFKKLQKPAPPSHSEQANGDFTKPDGDFETRIALIIMISLIYSRYNLWLCNMKDKLNSGDLWNESLFSGKSSCWFKYHS